MTSSRIDRDEMYRMLLAALPEFAARWQNFHRDWSGDPRALPEYPALEDISRYASYETQHRRHEPLAEYRRTLEVLRKRGDAFVAGVARSLADDLRSGRDED